MNSLNTTISNYILTLKDQPGDFTFVCKDGNVTGHIFLFSRAEYFRTFLSSLVGGTKKSCQLEANMCVFNLFKEYIYTDVFDLYCAKLDIKNLCDLHNLMRMWHADENIINVTLKYVKDNLDKLLEENLEDISFLFDCFDIDSEITNFFIQNKELVSISLDKRILVLLPDDFYFEIVPSWTNFSEINTFLFSDYVENDTKVQIIYKIIEDYDQTKELFNDAQLSVLVDFKIDFNFSFNPDHENHVHDLLVIDNFYPLSAKLYRSIGTISSLNETSFMVRSDESISPLPTELMINFEIIKVEKLLGIIKKLIEC